MNSHKSRRVCRREGQILIMTVLALVVLAGMAFYVYNTGAQINDRVAMQSAADSAAASGTVQLARGMNVVAMNNVAMAKLLATVVVLDSVPLATSMSMAETNAWEASLQTQLNKAVPIGFSEDAPVRAALTALHDRIAKEQTILAPVDAALNHSDFSMAATTNWSVAGQNGAAGGQGTLWQAIIALQQFNVATKASWGALAQANAARYGKSDKADVAFLTPILPVMPAYLGAFQDFQPLLRGSEFVSSNAASFTIGPGGPGGAIPDMVYPYRLGPYARLLHWRYPWTRLIGATWIPQAGSVGNVAVDSGAGSKVPSFGGGTSVGGTTLNLGYRTYGPIDWAVRTVGWWANGNLNGFTGSLPDTDFAAYLSWQRNPWQALIPIKLEYMFGSRAIKQIPSAKWISNYDDAKSAAGDLSKQPFIGCYCSVTILSSVPEGGPNWLGPGTCWTNAPGFGYDPNVTPVLTKIVDVNRWDTQYLVDHPGSDRRTWTRLGNYVWKGKMTAMTPSCPPIITLKLDGNGRPILQPLYLVEIRVFCGLGIGQVDVSNPCNWSNADVPNLPQPMRLDPAKGDCADLNAPGIEVGADVGMRRKQFTFLGVAQHTATSNLWPKQFPAANPSGNMVTVAQAELFNNSSWDLWTQDWRVQLVPVTQWDDWTAQMAAGAGDASATNGVLQPNEVTTVAEYLKRLNSQMVEAYIHH